MLPALLLVFFVLGTIIGSFLNVVVLRYGAKKLSGRSMCFSCGKTLRWFELIPVLSFLLQRGRCRGCSGRVSFQYPLVEGITGLVFAAVAWKEFALILSLFSSSSSFPLISSVYLVGTLLLWSLLIALSLYDVTHKIIPDGLVYTAGFVSLVLLFLGSAVHLQPATSFDFWAGFFFPAPFALLWFFSKGRAIGLGDAKLIMLFPWFLGFSKGLSALIIGFWIGAAVSLTGLLLKSAFSRLPSFFPNLSAKLQHLGMKTELPLGPFLVLGLFLVYVFGWDVTGLSLLLPR